jgi:hypothetical protein
MPGIRYRMRVAEFERRLASDGSEVTYRRTVAGQAEPVEQDFTAIVSELRAEDQDATDDDRRGYRRVATLDALINSVDADGEPLELSTPGVIEIDGENWQLIRMSGRDHGPDAVSLTWLMGLGKPTHVTARR